MAKKSEFQLAKPPVTALKKDGLILPICAPVGGGALTLTVAQIEAALIAAGCVSPNDATNPPQIVRINGKTVPKGRETINSTDDTPIIATGEKVIYTDEKGTRAFINEGEYASDEVCVVDENCDKIPDVTIDDTVQYEIPEGSCVMFEIDIA